MTHIQTTNTVPVQDGQKKYAELRAAVQKAGLLNRSYTYYAVLISIIVIGFFASGYFVVTKENIGWVIFWGVIFSFFSVQLAGLMHDAGHRSICKTTRMNDLIGFITAGMVAMGYSSWKVKHNMHHAHTNEEDEDPDVEMPILSFTKEQHARRRGLQKFLSRYQAFLYYPIGSLLNISVRVTSMKYFIKEFKARYIWEMAWLVIGVTIMFVVPFFIFSIAKATTLFLVINFTVGFYLLNVFAPNHKGMPVIAKGKKFSFLEQQVMTSRNIMGNMITDFVYMGLNYQIEHHLFPDCPRNKLKRLSPYIKKVCNELNLEYTEVGVIETNKIIVSELHQIARSG